MAPEQWDKVVGLFHAAREKSREERVALLEASCDGDPVIREIVERMLREDEDASGFLADLPVAGFPGVWTADIQPGQMVSHYRIGLRLGAGGMGTVYQAEDTKLKRHVALKFLSPEPMGGPASRSMREAWAASALNHPNIVTIHEVLQHEGIPVIVMELADGPSLRAFAGTPLAIDQVIDIGGQVARGLAAAHAGGIVHRDIKPENILLRRDGLVKLVDFGLARQSSFGNETSSRGLAIGTLRYMSPEQARGESVMGSSDIFSLGLVLYELATGRHPFPEVSPLETMYAITTREPLAPSKVNPKVLQQLDALILVMLSKEPSRRPSAEDVGRSLETLAAQPAPDRPTPRRRSVRAISIVVAAVVILLSVGGVAFWRSHDRLVAAPGPRFRQITTNSSENRLTAAAISPDGKTVAYADVGGSLSLRAVDSASIQALHTFSDFLVDRILWFPDGARLLLSGHTSSTDLASVWVFSIAHGEPRLLRQDATGASPSPDGTKLAMTVHGGSEIWTMGVNGEQPRKVIAGGVSEVFPLVIWSPDSRRLLYHHLDSASRDRRPDAYPGGSVWSLESIDLGTGQVASVPNLDISSACPVADGRLVFSRAMPPTFYASNLWEARIDLRTGRVVGAPRQLTGFKDFVLSSVTASSDGKDILVLRQDPQPDVYVADWERGELANIRKLTLDESYDFPHAWTADSKAVIFESDRDGTVDLFRQALDDRAAKPIVTAPGAQYMPQVSSDGRWVLYASSGESGSKDRALMRVPVEGGKTEQISLGGEPLDEFRCPMPGGKRCVLRATENRQYVFYELDPIRGKGRELARTPYLPGIIGDWTLSPDGSLVAIPNHSDREARIYMVALDAPASGPAEWDVNISGYARLNGINWAADGKGWFAVFRRNAADRSGLWESELVYVDLAGRARVLRQFNAFTFAVPSPDGRHLAFLDRTLTSNAWLLDNH